MHDPRVQDATPARGAWRGRAIRFASFTLIALACDQILKLAALSVLGDGRPLPVLPFLNLRLGYNTGVSFGLFSETFRGTPWLLAAFGIGVVLLLGWLGLRAIRPAERLGFALVAGGALGNIADRLRIGAVVDFVDLYYRNWHWPAFNLADVFIVCGVALLLAAPMFGRKSSVPGA